MGSFNVKCSLTGIDIVAGDPCILLLGHAPTNTPYQGGYQGVSSQFQPRTIPLYGKYNDYGWIEDVDPEAITVALQVLAIQYPSLFNEEEEGYPQTPETFYSHEFYQEWSSASFQDIQEGRVTAWVHRWAWEALQVAFRDYKFSTHMSFSEEDVKTHGEEFGISEYFHRDMTSTELFDFALGALERFPLRTREQIATEGLGDTEVYKTLLARGLSPEESLELAGLLIDSKEVVRMLKHDCPTFEEHMGVLPLGSMFPFWPYRYHAYPAPPAGEGKRIREILVNLLPIVRDPGNRPHFEDLDRFFTVLGLSRTDFRPLRDLSTPAQWIEPEMRILHRALAQGTLGYYDVQRPTRD